jgi:serpin B
LQDGYEAPLEQADFKTNPEGARATINAWVGAQTRQKIASLIPPDGLTRDTRLLLVNALYLKAPWEGEFWKYGTRPRPFKARGTITVDVPTMEEVSNFGYAKQLGYTAVTVQYSGNGLQFLILLPDDPAGVDALAAKITPGLLRDCVKLNRPDQDVDLYLPKFRLEPATMQLSQMLEAMGLKSAFDQSPGSANFDRMAPRRPDESIAISEVFHKAYLEVDEGGTEAAAATAVEAVVATAPALQGPPPPPPIIVHVDHPFIFAIQHRASGACLFLGRVTDPR